MSNGEKFAWPDGWTSAIPAIERRVSGVCAALGLSVTDTDDVRQKVLLHVHKASFIPARGSETIRTFDSLEKLLAWAGLVAKSFVRDMRIAAGRTKMTSAVDPTDIAAPPAGASEAEPMSHYLVLLDDPVEQEVLRLSYEEDLKLKDVAAAVGRSVGYVHGVLHRAIGKLRRRLSDDR